MLIFFFNKRMSATTICQGNKPRCVFRRFKVRWIVEESHTYHRAEEHLLYQHPPTDKFGKIFHFTDILLN